MEGSTEGSGSVSSIAGEYLKFSYNDRNHFMLEGSSFKPLIVKMNGSVITGIDKSYEKSEDILLPDFGVDYDNLIVIAANNSTTSDDNSYTYKFAAEEITPVNPPGSEASNDDSGTSGCFIAAASYAETCEREPGFVMQLIRNILIP